MRKKIIYIIGTRPEIIRSALIISKLKVDSKVLFRLVHTGQHYDYLMDKIFFKELNLPDPDINLEVGSMTHSKQIAEIILKLENFYLQFQPDLVVVFGDTNSSLAGALTAAKLNIPIAHIEAGCREWEMDLPEELNRRLIDHCSNLLLTVSETWVKNLENEEVMGKIYNLGDPLYYVFKKYYDISLNTELSNKLGLEDRKYFLLTLHRSKNVDNIENLVDILSVFDYFNTSF
ncbi:MAG: UDP-N-acetylglucosamine 2-epimerase [Cyanobacteria bacterium]|nr:UDP-N-acetylglucosamine 2-epimerase [Cyanobacteriota bacterium]